MQEKIFLIVLLQKKANFALAYPKKLHFNADVA